MHSNRYPITGTISYTNYQAGKKYLARSPKSSELNERSSIVVKSDNGTEILIRQVAGAVAPRIVTYSKKGARVRQGQPAAMGTPNRSARAMSWASSSSVHVSTSSFLKALRSMCRCLNW
jgi:phosphatidylserine decarboxylase precursor-related protein